MKENVCFFFRVTNDCRIYALSRAAAGNERVRITAGSLPSLRGERKIGRENTREFMIARGQ